MDLSYYMELMEDVHRFVICTTEDNHLPRDYGKGRLLNMVEMHTLELIAQQPGICVTEVAKVWNRTLAAASKNVNRLCEKGYVEKRKHPGNDKTIHLYPTESGLALVQDHIQSDRNQLSTVMDILFEKYTEEDLKIFHKILLTGIDIYNEHYRISRHT